MELPEDLIPNEATLRLNVCYFLLAAHLLSFITPVVVTADVY